MFNPLQLLLSLPGRGLFRLTSVMILVITRASLLCGKVRCPRIILDSWFLWWETILKTGRWVCEVFYAFYLLRVMRRLGIIHLLVGCKIQPQHALFCPRLFLCRVSQYCWDTAVSKGLGTSHQSRYCVRLFPLGTQWRPPRLQIVPDMVGRSISIWLTDNLHPGHGQLLTSFDLWPS